VRAWAPALAPVFPVWGEDTAALARRFIADGFRATLVCVDPRQVPAALCGRPYDAALLAELPASADPCGERGEFHTFVHDGPVFARAAAAALGEVVERDGFWFADLLPPE
jgi:diphthamide synthase (EF-2-diphthine--ammonia ligase)